MPIIPALVDDTKVQIETVSNIHTLLQELCQASLPNVYADLPTDPTKTLILLTSFQKKLSSLMQLLQSLLPKYNGEIIIPALEPSLIILGRDYKNLETILQNLIEGITESPSDPNNPQLYNNLITFIHIKDFAGKVKNILLDFFIAMNIEFKNLFQMHIPYQKQVMEESFAPMEGYDQATIQFKFEKFKKFLENFSFFTKPLDTSLNWESLREILRELMVEDRIFFFKSSLNETISREEAKNYAKERLQETVLVIVEKLFVVAPALKYTYDGNVLLVPRVRSEDDLPHSSCVVLSLQHFDKIKNLGETFQEVTLKNIKFTDEKLLKLTSAMASFQYTSLSIDNCDFSEVEKNIYHDFITVNLSSLEFASCKFNSKSLESFISFLKEQSKANLKRLSLTDLKLEHAIQAFCQYIETNNTITFLEMQNCVTSEHVGLIADALKKNQKLQFVKLYLSKDSSLLDFADLPLHNNTIRNLYFCDADFAHKTYDVKMLLQFIKAFSTHFSQSSNTSLQCVDVIFQDREIELLKEQDQKNPLSTSPFGSIAELVIVVEKTIKKLDLNRKENKLMDGKLKQKPDEKNKILRVLGDTAKQITSFFFKAIDSKYLLAKDTDPQALLAESNISEEDKNEVEEIDEQDKMELN